MGLKVLYRETLVGSIELSDFLRMEFQYTDSWKNMNTAFPISASLPFSENWRKGETDHRFFSNLLPEQGARESICRALGISVENDYELLKAIGGECAGALVIVPSDQDYNSIQKYKPLDDNDIRKAAASHLSQKRLQVGGRIRLSLAGAQDKWPVFKENGKLYLPEGNAASTHILKLANLRFKGLHYNEGYVTFLAEKLGLPVPSMEIHPDYTLSKRYDRDYNSKGSLIRIHQEDFCQALGYSQFSKYEEEGGPDFKECADLLRRLSVSPAQDFQNLLRWQFFNLFIGNSDGHAKNLSILYTEEGPRLAPFYDFVSTRVYDDISRFMAMKFGAENDPGQIIFRIAEQMLNSLEESLDNYRDDFLSRYGANPIYHRINLLIRRQLKRSRRIFKII